MPRVYYFKPGEPPRFCNLQGGADEVFSLLEGEAERFSLNWGPPFDSTLTLVRNKDATVSMLRNFNFYLNPFNIDGMLKGWIAIHGPALFARYNASGDVVDVTDTDVSLIQEYMQR